MTKNLIAFGRNLVVAPDNGLSNEAYVATIQANLMRLGYILTDDAFEAMTKADVAWLTEFNDEIISHISKQLGDDKDYQPIYKNFPQEVIAKDEWEILLERIVHYMSCGTWVPSTELEARDIKFEFIHFKELHAATEDEFKRIFTALVALNQSLTPKDQAVVDWFVKAYGNDNIFPDTIPFKETLCRLASLGLDVPVKTPTDVLRIAAYMSYGSAEISLPKRWVKENAWDRKWVLNPELNNMKFRSFDSKERQHLLSLLEKTGANKYEMAIWKNRWIRLGEKLHPGRYKDQYPKTFAAFDYLRNAKHTRTWYSFVDQAFAQSLEAGLEKLAERPGEFLRRLDALLRNNAGQEELVLSYFQRVGVGASNKVLFSLLDHFEKRLIEQPRSVLHKKALRRISLPALDPIDPELNIAILSSVKDILAEKFSTLKSLGKCWIDPELKNVAMPTDMRSMLESSVVVAKGTRVKLDNPEAKVIRFYVHWNGRTGGTDLDLGAYFYNIDGTSRELYYGTNGLRLDDHGYIYAVHSGDVRHVPGPCAEYVDVDIAKATAAGYRYVVMKVHDFHGRGLKYHETTCGFMEREHPESNKIWVPSTVTNAIKLDTESRTVNALIFDLVNREYIMVVEPWNGLPTPACDSNGTPISLQQWLEPPKFSVYDLLELHVNNRGQHVTVEEAEKQFLYEDFVQSYEALSEWMGV